MKKTFFTILLTFSQLIYSQNLIKSYNYDLENVKLFKHFINKTNRNAVLVFGEKSKTDFVLFDENFNEKSKISIVNADNSIIKIIGFSIENDKYYFYSQKNDTEIEVNEFNFDTKNVKTSSISFQIQDNERIISAINNQSSDYLITAIKNTNVLNLYIFNNGTINKRILDCSLFNLYDSRNKKVNLWDFLSEKNLIVYKNVFMPFEEPYHADIIQSTQKKKVFFFNDQIIIGTDLNNDSSQYLFININQYTISQKTFKKENVNNDTSDSNSFFVNDKIFILKVKGFITYLIIKDLDDNMLKKFTFSPASTSNLKNFAPYLESGSFTERELIEKPEIFFRKVCSQQASVFAHFQNNKYYFTFGSASYPKPAANGFGVFGLAKQINGITGAGNGAGQSIYCDKYIVYTKDILDNNFEPNAEKITSSPFENLRTFMESNKTKDFFINTIYYEKDIVLIMYNKNEAKLKFYKF